MGTRKEELKRNEDIATAATRVKQDLILERLEDNKDKLNEILRQLQLTHRGHEEELWDKEITEEDHLDGEVETE